MPSPQNEADSHRTDVPVLRSLGPEYDENLHGRHARALLKVLADRSANAPRNIALAGHYGSGKSSVLLGVQKGLDSKKIPWVNLSLSSLGVDNTKRARVQEDGSVAPLTNLIQKEIVKQLLYRKAPKDMPGSRYFRIDSFNASRAWQWSAAVALGFFAIAVLLGLVTRVKEVAPTWIAEGPGWAPWGVVGVLGVFTGVICFLTLRGLQNPLKVESVSAGGAAVTLRAKENSYFDEYLDEIVYFFQQTRTRIAIFEDLDRFKDPHIFETLRELNTVLNHSEQVRARPVKFVYAVRDSIFEQLDAEVDHPASLGSTDADAPDGDQSPVTPDGSVTPDPATPRASLLESAPSSNRTKFFDLVVPMVPFLTHRSARDLLAEEFKTSSQKPSPTVVSLVGADRALADMRLIRNIRNEFEMYRASVLSDKGLQGLSEDRLFAMMVYKNTHLEDFEAIRLGTSRIDAAHRAYRQMVEYQVSYQAKRRWAALRGIRRAEPWDERARHAGETLQRVLPVLHRANRQRGGAEPEITTTAGRFQMSELTSGKFWAELFESGGSIDIGIQGYQPTRLSFDELLMLAGEQGHAMKSHVEMDLKELRRISLEARETKDFVAKASMPELMARADLTMPFGASEKRNLDEIVAELVSPLARNLLAQGFIDENFTLYCSDYQGVAISVSAMNFILHCVQVDRADPLFRFDAPQSIDSVRAEMGERFLGGESVFNLEVFNHYLTNDHSCLASAFDRIAVRASTGDTSFVDLYLEDETVAATRTKHELLKQIAPLWPEIFTHTVAGQSAGPRVEFLDTIIRSASNNVNYQTSDQVINFVQEHYSQMTIFKDAMPTENAESLANLLLSLDVNIRDLSLVGEAQLDALVATGLYPVTRANLHTALSRRERDDSADSQVGEHISLALDDVKSRNSVVYSHLVRNLPDYLDALSTDEFTVAESESFVDVISDISGLPANLIQTVAERASASCTIGNLADVDRAAWPPVVAAHRFVTSVSNVILYVQEYGVTSELAGVLVEQSLAEVDAVDEQMKTDLAYALIEAETLGVPDRVSLIGELEKSDYLDPSRLSTGLTLLPELVAAGHVSDDAETFACLSDQPISSRTRYFELSEGLVSYVTDLELTADDLNEIMKNADVPRSVKAKIANDAVFVAGRISRSNAITICNWALMGNDVSTALLLELCRAKAPAEKILVLLEPHLPSITLDTLDSILDALGGEYQRLTSTGHHVPRLKEREGTEALLDALKRLDRVSSYSEPRLLVSEFKVYMRR
ncbi:hypothetical protein AAFP35_11440 [Gordonia sp. CPCC 206044]|uniref:YobI family P-loop NTPase n=1 Tax=Gordonia sp. CPCC 206044 TaxID=3140793 RepID=UPI003AF3FDE8